MFQLTRAPLDAAALRARLAHPDCGACVAFEGWVRNRNEGRAVLRLEYEAYPALAVKEGERILQEALRDFPIKAAHCVHRLGLLEIGETAVWIGAVSPHRQAAFAACEWLIAAVKHRVPIWKREHYADGGCEWILCAHDADHADHAAAH